MNSAIRVFNSAVLAEGDGGYVSEKVRRSAIDFLVCDFFTHVPQGLFVLPGLESFTCQNSTSLRLFFSHLAVLSQDLAVITDADFQVLLDELLAYEAVGKLDAIVA